jgi:hypothetical protein
MKVLTSNGGLQTIRIIPRSYPTLVTLTLRDDQTNDLLSYELSGEDWNLLNVDWNLLNIDWNGDVPSFFIENDYLLIRNSYILEEYHFYDLNILDQDSNIIYKDRIFCTNQVVDDFSVNADSGYISQPSNNDYIII